MKKKLIGAGVAIVALVAILSGCIIVNGTDGKVYFEWDTDIAAVSDIIVDNTTTGSVPIARLDPIPLSKNATFSYQYSYISDTSAQFSNSVNVDFYDRGTSGDLFTAGSNGGDVYFIVDLPTASQAITFHALPIITLASSKRSLGTGIKIISTVVNGNTTTRVFDTGKALITNVTTVTH